jgi:hypothetical protein
MSTPSPKRPNKLTCIVSKDGLSSDYIYDIYEISKEIPEDLKPYLERRTRERREARERAAQNPPPHPDNSPPIDENKPAQ